MASLTPTTFDAAMKQLYRPANFYKTVYERRPALGLFPKYENFGGRNMPIVNLYGNAQGRSATFATAQTNATSLSVEDFLLTRVKDYHVGTIDGEALEATEGDDHAFVSALKAQVDSGLASLSDSLESSIFRTGTGSIGQAGTISTTSLTLLDINDITHYDVNQELVASAADGGALRTGSATVTAINRTTGVLTSDSNWTAQITSFAVNDFVYVQGDAANGGANIKLSGINAWLPDSVTATAFFGVDRTVDSRLHGITHTGTGQLIEEALIDSASKASREGGAPDLVLLNQVQMRKLIKELGSKKEYDTVNATSKMGLVANVGYRGVVIHGDSTEMKVVAANKCQPTKAWVLEMRTWQLASIGPAVKFLMKDGQKILRQSSDDGYEFRVGFKGNVGCRAPVYNVNCTLAAAT